MKDHDFAVGMTMGLMAGAAVGIMVTPKRKRSIQKAADKGSTRAMYLLGQCYEQGSGVKRDPEKARELYRQAADKGSQKAKEALGRMAAAKAPAPQKSEQKKDRKGWWPFGKK